MSCGRRKAALAALLIVMVASPFASAAWPSFRGDSHNSGSGPAAHAPFDEVWWTSTAPGGAGIAASPVAKGGLVIVADLAGNVRALDNRSGVQAWAAKMTAPVEGTPVIAGDLVYVVDTKGALKSFALRTGALVGTAAAGPTRGTLAEHEGKLFIGNEAGELRAFLSDLSPLWTFKVSDIKVTGNMTNLTATACKGTALPTQPVRGKPAVFDGAVYAGSLNHYVFAVDESGSGDLKTSVNWIYKTGDLVDASPAIVSTASSDRLVVGSYDGTVYAFDARQPLQGTSPCFGVLATPAWTYAVPSNTTVAGTVQASRIHSSAAGLAGRVYVGSNGGDLVALDAATGGEAWTVSIGGRNDGVSSSPSATSSTVVVGSDDGFVYWLDPTNGSVQRRFAAGSQVGTSPALDGELAYVSSHDGLTFAFGPLRPPQPDLTVAKLDLSLAKLTAVVANLGTNASNGSAVLRIYDGTRLLVERPVPALQPGKDTRVELEQAFPPRAYALSAIVDPLDAEVERDESNNRLLHNATLKESIGVRGGNDTGNETNGTGKGGGKFLGIPSVAPPLVAAALVAVALLVRRRRD